ncbi:MAG TPA: phosphatidate cytidylyltransferase [Flavobacterium sp.]|jgi:phosphatidate cytidylyltransferase
MIEKIQSFVSKLDLFEKKDILQVVGIIFIMLIVASAIFFIWGKLKPEKNLVELKQRTNSWWIMVVFFVLAVLLDRAVTFPAIGLLSFMAFRELYSILGFRDADRRAILWAILAIPFQYYLAYIGWYEAFIILIPVGMFLFVPIRLVLIGETKGIIKSMASLQWALMLTVFGISHLAFFLSLPERPKLPNFENGGQGLLLFLVFITQINDVMQFIWGKLFGKHKIIPIVSPNKTWEGFIGGVISTIIIGYFLAFLTPLDTPQVLFASFLIACSGFFGDIVMSAIKRDLGVKDTGSAIPGHGGILDRIDSLTYTAPVFFHLMYYWLY